MIAVKSVRWQYIAAAIVVLTLAFLLPHHNGERQLSLKQQGLNPRSAAQLPEVQSGGGSVPAQLISGGAPLESASPLPSPPVVYVCGAVRKPGVYRLKSNARIIDAIQQAGGALADADPEQLNLAEPASDGMKIAVPHKGQMLAQASGIESGLYAQTPPRVSTRRSRHSAHSGQHKLQPGQTLNVNTAAEQELTALPGVGPGLARRIVEYRSANGPFQTVDDLQNVSGIGPSKFEKMAPYIKL